MGNETDDDEASQPRQTGPSSATSQTEDDFFFAKNFVLLQSCYGIQRPPKFTSYKLLDGLIDDGEFIVFYDLYKLYYCFEFSSSRSFCFCFKVNTDLEQLLTCSYSKFRLLKRIQCCNVLPYLSSLRASHNYIMFRSPLEIVAFRPSR